jgi:hypothetical protein
MQFIHLEVTTEISDSFAAIFFFCFGFAGPLAVGGSAAFAFKILENQTHKQGIINGHYLRSFLAHNCWYVSAQYWVFLDGEWAKFHSMGLQSSWD